MKRLGPPLLAATGIARSPCLLAGSVRGQAHLRRHAGRGQRHLAERWPGPRSTFDATRAITIERGPSPVMALARPGRCRRAGWYSYDILDNLGRPSAGRSCRVSSSSRGRHPDEPRRHAGDPECLAGPAALDGLGNAGRDDLGVARGARPDGSTRLLARIRSRYDWPVAFGLFSILVSSATSG